MTDLCRVCDKAVDPAGTIHWNGESAAHVECYVAEVQAQRALQEQDDRDAEDPRVLAHQILALAKRLADPTMIIMAEELILACEDGDYDTAEFIDAQIKERAADISTILRGLRP